MDRSGPDTGGIINIIERVNVDEDHLTITLESQMSFLYVLETI